MQEEFYTVPVEDIALFKNIHLHILLCMLSLFIASCARQPGPADAVQSFSRNILDKKWDLVWDSITYKNQKDFEDKVLNPMKLSIKAAPQEKMELKHPTLGVSADDLLRMSAKDFFVLSLEKTDVRDKMLQRLTPEHMDVEKVAIHGNTAKVTLKGRAQDITLQKENGTWKICIF